MTAMKWFITLLLSLLLLSCSERKQSEPEQSPGRKLDYTHSVTFVNTSGEDTSSIDVAIADDDDSRNEGLMDVRELPPDNGMLFIFENEQPRSFWMANTPLSLDIIFINADFEIVRIHRNTPSYSNENFESGVPAKYVVEVNAGYTLEHDITEQMTIRIDP